MQNIVACGIYPVRIQRALRPENKTTEPSRGACLRSRLGPRDAAAQCVKAVESRARYFSTGGHAKTGSSLGYTIGRLGSIVYGSSLQRARNEACGLSRSHRGRRRLHESEHTSTTFAAAAAAQGGGAEAESVVAEQHVDSQPSVATFPPDTEPIWSWRRQVLGRMLLFLGPAIFIPLADPLMSVVDTVAVGQYASTTELAGLGPVTLIFTFVNYIWNSQGIATTTLVADALNCPRSESVAEPQIEAGRVLASSLVLAATAGVTVCAVLQAFGPQLLQLTGAAPELMEAAISYLRIRAFATPAAFGIVVSQAALLAQRKSLLPCLVITASALVNLGLDVALIVNFGMGVAGAAWATLASQYLSMGLMLTVLHSRRSQVKPQWHVPSVAQLQAFTTSTGPLAFIYICKNICYMSLQRAATVLPVLHLAAHQPVFMLWNLCAFAITPVEQAALAFLPSATTVRQRAELPKMIMVTGLAFAAASGLVSSAIPWFLPQLFSPDQRLYPLMRQMAPLGFLAMLTVGAEVAATAVLLSKKQYKLVSDTMFRTVLIMSGYMALLGVADLGITGVWLGLSVFYGSRMLQNIPSMLRVLQQEASTAPYASENDDDEKLQLNPKA